MNNITDEDKIDRLPKWAQNLFDIMKKNIAHLENQLSQVSGSVENGYTEMSWRNGLENGHPIPHHSRISFRLGPDRHDDIDIRLDEDTFHTKTLRIQGDRGIVIFPRASNVVHIKLEE